MTLGSALRRRRSMVGSSTNQDARGGHDRNCAADGGASRSRELPTASTATLTGTAAGAAGAGPESRAARRSRVRPVFAVVCVASSASTSTCSSSTWRSRRSAAASARTPAGTILGAERLRDRVRRAAHRPGKRAADPGRAPRAILPGWSSLTSRPPPAPSPRTSGTSSPLPPSSQAAGSLLMPPRSACSRGGALAHRRSGGPPSAVRRRAQRPVVSGNNGELALGIPRQRADYRDRRGRKPADIQPEPGVDRPGRRRRAAEALPGPAGAVVFSPSPSARSPWLVPVGHFAELGLAATISTVVAAATYGAVQSTRSP